ncbi:MAG: LysR substrate-binding domain-containing protein [Desulfosarcinaceae bacterium]
MARTRYKKSRLDLAVYEAARLDQGMELLREESMTWAASRAHGAQFRGSLPAAVFDRACWWRDAALETLEASGRNYRVVYSSESVTGVVAAVEAGIAVGFLAGSCLHEGLVRLAPFPGAHRVPTSKLVLHYGRTADDPITTASGRRCQKGFFIRGRCSSFMKKGYYTTFWNRYPARCPRLRPSFERIPKVEILSSFDFRGQYGCQPPGP